MRALRSLITNVSGKNDQYQITYQNNKNDENHQNKQKSESSRMAKHHHVPFAKLFYSETSALLQVWSQHLRCAVLQGTAQPGWC